MTLLGGRRSWQRRLQLKELWLTHYSPSLVQSGGLYGECTQDFSATHSPGKDGKSTELDFEEE